MSLLVEKLEQSAERLHALVHDQCMRLERAFVSGARAEDVQGYVDVAALTHADVLTLEARIRQLTR